MNSTSEEIKLTVGHVLGDPGQEQVKKAIKNGEQLRVWVIETKNVTTINTTLYLHMYKPNLMK